MMFGEEEVGVLKSSHKVYISDKFDLTIGWSMSEVPLKSLTMRSLHDIQMSYDKDSYETTLINLDGDGDMPYILSNMLTMSQGHKENDDKVHEDVEANATRDKDGG